MLASNLRSDFQSSLFSLGFSAKILLVQVVQFRSFINLEFQVLKAVIF
jgi:hypothetical protein